MTWMEIFELITSTENEKKRPRQFSYRGSISSHFTLDNIVVYALLVRACPFLIVLDQALPTYKWGGLRKSSADLHEHSGFIQEAKEAPRQEENPQHFSSMSHLALYCGEDNDSTRPFYANVADLGQWTHCSSMFPQDFSPKEYFNINIALCQLSSYH